jgi:hypothetical protein
MDKQRSHRDVQIDFFRVPTTEEKYLFINTAQITRVALNHDGSASIYLADGGQPVIIKGDILDTFVSWVEARNVLTLISKDES